MYAIIVINERTGKRYPSSKSHIGERVDALDPGRTRQVASTHYGRGARSSFADGMQALIVTLIFILIGLEPDDESED